MNNINKEAILFELNRGKTDKELEELIDKFIIELEEMPWKSNFRIFKTNEIKNILIGEDIKLYVKDSNEVAVFIVTLNVDVDKRLRVLEKTDKLAYIVYDKVCSHYIEDKAEELQTEISKELLKNNRYMLSRFSTGYGDFPIDVNKDIVNITNANRLGVFLTDKNMFMPSKTISGIIASGDSVKSFNFCKTCNITDKCEYIKKGRKCYE